MRIALSGKLTLILTHWPLLWNTGQFFLISLEFDITKIYSVYCLHTLWGSALAEPGISFRFHWLSLWNEGQFFCLNLKKYFLYFNCCVFAVISLIFFIILAFVVITRVSFFKKTVLPRQPFSIRFYHTPLF